MCDECDKREWEASEAEEAAAIDAALRRDHERAVRIDAADMSEVLVERVESFQRAAMEKAGRTLTELEMRTISVRTLIALLLERGHACAQCCRAIARAEDAIAVEREFGDCGDRVRTWTLIHAPVGAEAQDPNCCLAQARRRGVYMAFIRCPALPVIERARTELVVSCAPQRLAGAA